MAPDGTVTGGVLVGLDGSPASNRALEFALERYAEDPITALYVIDPYESDHRGLLPPLLGYWGDWYERAAERPSGPSRWPRRSASAGTSR